MSLIVSAAASAAVAGVTGGALTTVGAAIGAAGAGGVAGVGVGGVAGAAAAGAAGGATAAGVTAGTAAGAAAAGIGAGAATGSALGSGIGAISAAIQGQDVGEGAMMGAVSGLATAGAAGVAGAAVPAAISAAAPITTGAVVGGAAGAAGGAAGAAAGGKDVGMGALIGGAGGAVTGGALKALSPTPGAAPVAGAAKAPLNNITPETSMFDGTAKWLQPYAGADAATGADITTGLQSAGLGAATEYAGNSMVDSARLAKEDAARGLANESSSYKPGLAALDAAGLPSGSGPLGQLGSIGKATGGITALAKGGQVPLKNGAYIIPADVVSALGNGSTKAGAEYLQRLMIEVRKEAINIQGMGAAKKHVV